MNLIRLGRAVLTDEKFPDPVVPPDLALVKPAQIDGDGRVACIYCKTPVLFAKAHLIGSDGFACQDCVARFSPTAQIPDDITIGRGPVPYLIAVGVVGAIAGIIAVAAH